MAVETDTTKLGHDHPQSLSANVIECFCEVYECHVAACFSPVAGEGQKPYQWCLDLRGIHIDFQGGGFAQGASENNSGESGPGSCRLLQGEIFLYDCHMTACCPLSCICGQL